MKGEVVNLVRSIPEEKLEDVHDGSEKGSILIKIFDNKPYEVSFSGVVTGTELDNAWRFMMKEYRVWKHTVFNKNEKEDKRGKR